MAVTAEDRDTARRFREHAAHLDRAKEDPRYMTPQKYRYMEQQAAELRRSADRLEEVGE